MKNFRISALATGVLYLGLLAPVSLAVPHFDQGIFLYVILITSLFMTYGLVIDSRNRNSE